jgi:hypothetical protein
LSIFSATACPRAFATILEKISNTNLGRPVMRKEFGFENSIVEQPNGTNARVDRVAERVMRPEVGADVVFQRSCKPSRGELRQFEFCLCEAAGLATQALGGCLTDSSWLVLDFPESSRMCREDEGDQVEKDVV